MRDQRWSTVPVACGTPGYGAPEYTRNAVVTEASEVYAFGMVIMEFLTAHPPAAPSRTGPGFVFLLAAIQPELDGAKERLLAIRDQRAKWPLDVAASLAALAILCVQEDPRKRPCFL